MATSYQALGNTANYSFLTTLKKRYKIHVYSRGANIVMLHSALVFCIYSITALQCSPVDKAVDITIPDSLSYVAFILYLVYPFLGILGEQIGYHKLINVGATSVIVSKSWLTIVKFVKLPTELTRSIMAVPGYMLLYLGTGIYITNFFQFGLNQLLFQPSDKLQSYIYIVLGVVNFTIAIAYFCFAILTKLLEEDTLIWAIVSVDISILLLCVLFHCLLCCCRRHIHTEPPPLVHPVKHIYKVMRYAWTNRHPMRRSAFTYTERPSRLDLCKERYGGPFTTDEVEDVKSFWQILMIIVSMCGIFCLDTTDVVANQYHYQAFNESYSDVSFTEIVIIVYPSTITFGSVFLCVLIMQLIYIPFLSRYLPKPRMVTRIGMGLLLALCTSCCHTLLSLWLDRELFPYGLLVIPQVLYGCAWFFSVLTGTEFIVAQSPLRMQGLLIGSYISLFFMGKVSGVLSKSMRVLWHYYLAKTMLVFLSCLLFMMAAIKYKYRERNEATDVNVYNTIAEYTERQLLIQTQSSQDSYEVEHTLSEQ